MRLIPFAQCSRPAVFFLPAAVGENQADSWPRAGGGFAEAPNSVGRCLDSSAILVKKAAAPGVFSIKAADWSLF